MTADATLETRPDAPPDATLPAATAGPAGCGGLGAAPAPPASGSRA